MFNEKLKQSFCKIIKDNGIIVCTEPSKLNGLLNDYCGEDKKEIFMIVSTAKINICKEITGSNIPIEIMKPKLVNKIINDLGFKNEVSENLVNLWLLGLGKINEEEYTKNVIQNPSISQNIKIRKDSRLLSIKLKFDKFVRDSLKFIGLNVGLAIFNIIIFSPGLLAINLNNENTIEKIFAVLTIIVSIFIFIYGNRYLTSRIKRF